MPTAKKARVFSPPLSTPDDPGSAEEHSAIPNALDQNHKETLFEVFGLLNEEDLKNVAQVSAGWRLVIKERNLLPLDREVLSLKTLQVLLFPQTPHSEALVETSVTIQARRELFSSFAPQVRVLVIGEEGLKEKDPLSKFLSSLTKDLGAPPFPKLQVLDNVFINAKTNITLLLALSTPLLRIVHLGQTLETLSKGSSTALSSAAKVDNYLHGLTTASKVTRIIIREPNRRVHVHFSNFYQFTCLEDLVINAAITAAAFQSILKSPSLNRLSLIDAKMHAGTRTPALKAWLKFLDTPPKEVTPESLAPYTSSSIQEFRISFDELNLQEPLAKLISHFLMFPHLKHLHLTTRSNHSKDLERCINQHAGNSDKISLVCVTAPFLTPNKSILLGIASPRLSLFQTLTDLHFSTNGWHLDDNDWKQFLLRMRALQRFELIRHSSSVGQESGTVPYTLDIVSLIRLLSTSKSLQSITAHVSIANLRTLARGNGFTGSNWDDTICPTPTLKKVKLVLLDRGPANNLGNDYNSFLNILGSLLFCTLPNANTEDMDIQFGDPDIPHAEKVRWSTGLQHRVANLRAQEVLFQRQDEIFITSRAFTKLVTEMSEGAPIYGGVAERVAKWVKEHLGMVWDPLPLDNGGTDASDVVEEAEGSGDVGSGAELDEADGVKAVD